MKIRNRRKIGVLIVMYAALFLFFSNTDPHNLPVGMLLACLSWLFACIFLTSLFAMHIIGTRQGAQDKYRQYVYAAVISGVPTGLLLLGSINQLTVKDVLLITLFSGIVLVYMTKFQLARKIE